MDFVYKLYDRYNWDRGKSVTLFGVTVTDQFMGGFHCQGLAKEFDCHGGVRRRFTWKEGDDISKGQLSSRVDFARGG